VKAIVTNKANLQETGSGQQGATAVDRAKQTQLAGPRSAFRLGADYAGCRNGVRHVFDGWAGALLRLRVAQMPVYALGPVPVGRITLEGEFERQIALQFGTVFQSELVGDGGKVLLPVDFLRA
jgi:hypothetical protein